MCIRDRTKEDSGGRSLIKMMIADNNRTRASTSKNKMFGMPFEEHFSHSHVVMAGGGWGHICRCRVGHGGGPVLKSDSSVKFREKLKVRKLKVCKPPAKAICATVACATHNEIDVQSAPKSAKLALRNRI